ncbi:MAG: adenylate/guanylate cyclase domain-containing protein, partial [Verrucomicrobiota bacterium]|nr:adenylate/guanylate cyclase domain-containing protein [Verrucomicrobiota bacterium]
WQTRDESWGLSPKIYQQAAKAALDLGEGFLAYDIAVEGLAYFKSDPLLAQMQALALARTGSPEAANAALRRLANAGHQDEETLGLLARTHKDLWQLAIDEKDAKRHLKECFELYHHAYRTTGGYYTGINAATMSLFSGKRSLARRIASEVQAICEERLTEHCGGEYYWLAATLAEAMLVRGKLSGAQEQYTAAVAKGDQGPTALSSTRTQAQFLLRVLGEDPNRFDECFELPTVAAFAGHMFDTPERKTPRFPSGSALAARRELTRVLKEHHVQIGYSSLACGGDTLFAETVLKLGGEVHIVLPFEEKTFLEGSVNLVPDKDWGRRFKAILGKAASVTILNPSGDPAEPENYEYCNRAVLGMAKLKARSINLDLQPIVMWDGQPGDGPGGTEAFIKKSRQLADPIILDTSKYLVKKPSRQKAEASAATGGQQIRAMLFADVVGFSKLDEPQIPSFVEHFMGAIAGALPKGRQAPLYLNTWGDAIYCVFRDVKDAGAFALALRDAVRGADWQKHGLPAGLSIRIGLHAGPVFECHDPVLKKRTYNGFNVNRAARIEPITEEGQVFVSQAFAALAAVVPKKNFRCDYAGTRQLAKKAGAIPVFVLRATA